MSSRRIVRRVPREIEKKQNFFLAFLKHLSKELGIPFGVMLSLVGVYNKFLFYMISSTGKYSVKRTSKAIGNVVKASSEAMMTLMGEIRDYISEHPGEITACGANIYLSKDSKGFTDELSTFAKQLGSREFKRIGRTAQQITQKIMDDFISKNIQNRLLQLPAGILPENLQSLLLPTTESLELVISNSPSSLQLTGLNETSELVISPSQESSAETLLKSMSCDVYGKLSKYGIDIFRGCDDYLLRTQGFSHIEERCPRIHEDINILVERVGEDLNHAVRNAITRASTDISKELSRTKHDLLFSANAFVVFLGILFLFLYIWRNIIIRIFRRATFSMKSPRKSRKSSRKVRKSFRKVRKSSRKARKSSRKARKSSRKARKSPRKVRKSRNARKSR
jgi:hypothetical protein